MATSSVTNTFTNATPADAGEVNANFSDLVGFLNSDVVHVDGSKPFTAVQSGIAPTADAHLSTKGHEDTYRECCIVRLAGSQSIPDSTADDQIHFDIKVREDDGYSANVAANQGGITVTEAGLYRVELALGFAANATGYRRISIFSDATRIADLTWQGFSGVVNRQYIAVTHDLGAGAVLTATAEQASGGALTTTSGAVTARFGVYRVGD